MRPPRRGFSRTGRGAELPDGRDRAYLNRSSLFRRPANKRSSGDGQVSASGEIEFGQLFHVADLLGLGQYRLVRVVLGTGFYPADSLAIAGGAVAVIAVEAFRRRRGCFNLPLARCNTGRRTCARCFSSSNITSAPALSAAPLLSRPVIPVTGPVPPPVISGTGNRHQGIDKP
jgi:hypothetical protein